MDYLPTIRQLQYLIALAEHGSFSKAAKNCNVTQSTLSAGIKELENLLGHNVVDRSNRRAALTPLGKMILEDAKAVIARAADITARARTLEQPLSDADPLHSLTRSRDRHNAGRHDQGHVRGMEIGDGALHIKIKGVQEESLVGGAASVGFHHCGCITAAVHARRSIRGFDSQFSSLQPREVSQQADVQTKAGEAGGRRRPQNAVVSAEIGVHRRGQQPQLQHDQHEDNHEHAVDCRPLLSFSHRPFHVRISTPVA